MGSCENLTPAPNGAWCGLDKVCKDGSCIACAAGSACATGTDCEAGRLDCSMETGGPVCVPAGAAPDGTPCTGGVCYAGDCRTDVCGGLAGTTCDSSHVCDRNGCGADVVGVCVPKVTCPTPMPPYAPVCGCNGTTYASDCLRQQAGVALAHTGACTSAAEDCFNGVDDNGDGLADCADPQCQAAATCVTTPPSGWTGIGWLDPDTLVTCPLTTIAEDLYESAALVAPPLTCLCECGAPSAACAVTLTCFGSDTTCNGSSNSPTSVSPGGCHLLNLGAGQSGCKAGEPQVSGGCPATLKTPTRTLTWNPTARACLRDAGGVCLDAGQTCVPRPPSDAIGPCIAKGGDYACPAAPYNVKHLYYSGQPTDSRGCTACPSTCAVTGSCTCDSGSQFCGVGVYSDDTCASSTPQIVPSTNVCAPVDLAMAFNYYVTTVGIVGPASTQCVPPTSTPTGSVVLGSKITVCCPQ